MIADTLVQKILNLATTLKLNSWGCYSNSECIVPEDETSRKVEVIPNDRSREGYTLQNLTCTLNENLAVVYFSYRGVVHVRLLPV